MTCKIIDFFTGKEIEGPSAERLRKRSAKLLTATGMSRQAGENSFESAGKIAMEKVVPKIKLAMVR